MSLLFIHRVRAAAVAMLVGCSVAVVQAQPAATTDATTARIMQRLAALAADSMEGRRAGTAGSVRARAWIVAELTAMGAKPIGSGFVVPVTLRARAGSDSLRH